MRFQIIKDKLNVLERDTLNSGSVKFYEATVEYDELWQDLIIEAILIKKGEKQGVPAAVINNVVYIDQKLDGIYYIGFCGFKEENDIKTYQISTNLEPIRFGEGAGSIEIKIGDLPTLNEWEIYIAQIQKFINESKQVVDEAERLNLSAVKEENCAIITITKKDGTEEQIYIYDGTDYVLTEEDKDNIVKETKSRVEEELSNTLEENLLEAKKYSDSNLEKAKGYSDNNLEQSKKYSDGNLEKAEEYSNNILEQSKEYSDDILEQSKEYADNNLDQSKKYSDDTLEQGKKYSDDNLTEAKKYADDIKPIKTSQLTNDSNFAKTNENNNFSTAQTINGTLTVNGDIVQSGESYETHAEKVYTEKDEIILRDKAIGGMTQEQFAGLVALLYNGIASGRLGFKADGTAYVGDVGDEQPLLTRDDVTNLTEGQVLIWDGAKLRAVGSSDFIKNTDLATSSEVGLVKANGSGGITVNSAGNISTVKATNDDIDNKTNNYKSIVPSNLDYAVKSIGDGYYVKNTDYATDSVGGIVKVNTAYGITMRSNNVLGISAASSTLINEKTNAYRPIVPSNLDYAVKQALADTKLEWTAEEKTKTRNLIGAVGTEDYAGVDKYGIVKFGTTGSTGLYVNEEGRVYTSNATNAEIDVRTNKFKVITPGNLDYAVKVALINAKAAWTDDEKTTFRNYISALSNTDYSTADVAGVSKVNPSFGIAINGTGSLYTNRASETEIDAKSSSYKVIVPANLNYAVGSVKASELQSGTVKVWTSINEDGEIGLNISTEV